VRLSNRPGPCWRKIRKADYLPTSCFIQWDRAGRTDAVCACWVSKYAGVVGWWGV
jgi:hypothetical protein